MRARVEVSVISARRAHSISSSGDGNYTNEKVSPSMALSPRQPSLRKLLSSQFPSPSPHHHIAKILISASDTILKTYLNQNSANWI